MEKEYRIVCFIDILGFKDIIKKYSETKDDNIVQSISKAFEESMKGLKGKYDSMISNKKALDYVKRIEYKSFSDNIIISIPYNNEDQLSFLQSLATIVSYARVFQYNMHTMGYFVRGGISFGEYFDDNHIVFSEALVKAYQIETNSSIYPRIVLDEDIIKRLISMYKNESKVLLMSKMIIKDWDDVFFIDYVNIIFEAAKLVQEEITNLNKEEKNKFIAQLNNNELINPELQDEFLNPLKYYETLFKSVVDIVLIESKKHTGNPYVWKKYHWLIQLLLWYRNPKDSTIQFEYFINFLERHKIIENDDSIPN